MPFTTGRQGVPVAGGDHAIYEELRLKTVSVGHSRPGRLVIRNTDDNHVVLAGDDVANALGWIYPNPEKDADADFAAEDWLQIGHGPGVVVPLTLATGQAITKGDHLSPAANGMLKASGSDPDSRLDIAVAEQSVTTTTLASASINVRMLR